MAQADCSRRRRRAEGCGPGERPAVRDLLSSPIQVLLWSGRPGGAMSEVTQILARIQAGDREATRALLPLVYAELRQLAQSRLAQEAPGQTLQATALVHEAYLRLAGPDPDAPCWDHRGHFFAAAEAMRRILIESARRRQSLKRGGGLVRQELDERVLAAPVPDEDLLALDEALVRLASVDPPAAPVLGISLRSAERLWSYARAWLFDALQSGVSPD